MPDLAAAELSIPAEQLPDPAKPLVIPVDSTVVGSTLRFIPWSVVTLSHPCVISVYGGSVFGSRQGARCSSVSLYLPYCIYQKTYGSCTCARLGVFCRSPFDGRPQGGGHLEPPARDSSGGCPGFIYPLGPGTYFRTDHFAQQPSAAAF